MRGRRPNWPLWLLAAVLWTLAVIWGNSLRTADQSIQQSVGLLDLLLPLLDWTGLSRDLLHTLIRKGAHMTEFAVLGLFWTQVWRGVLGDRDLGPTLGAALSCCLFTAVTDETIQAFVPGRGSLVTDVWIDMAGAALAVLGLSLLCRIRRYR